MVNKPNMTTTLNPNQTAQQQIAEEHVSKPEQEWTPKDIREIFEDAPTKENAFKRVSQALNTELSDESQRHSDAEQVWITSNGELTKELLSTLADNKRLKDQWELTNQDLQNTKQRELSALAAIEEALQMSDFPATVRRILEGIDLSLLREHDKELENKVKDRFRPTIRRIHDIAINFGWKDGGDTQSALDYIAEVRKPLVDALEQCFDALDTPQLRHARCSKKHVDAFKAARDALAKVKEQ